jgi:hypothetical protein
MVRKCMFDMQRPSMLPQVMCVLSTSDDALMVGTRIISAVLAVSNREIKT